MKRFLLLLTIVLSSLSLLATTAEAKRFGGGSSIGKQRTMSPQQTQKAPAAAPAPTAATPAAAPAGNKWLGPLAGLAIGAGLGALFASGALGGLGGAMGGILMALAAGAIVILLISMFRKKQQQPAMQYAGAGAPYGGSSEPVQQAASGSVAAIAPVAGSIPADFPVDAFLRSAKTSFIRLQAANDRKDLDDIREYTTPEMFAEISMQIRERDNTAQKTDVITVNAELLEVAQENDTAIASVRMSGQLRENNSAPENFDEVWYVQKNTKDDKAVWLLSGIQQIA
ncbi:MAG: Tim44-like domain-containing protein [Gallionellaceae bacterium]|jgi:predicted lipid-binding transport protein (Tim44 family)